MKSVISNQFMFRGYVIGKHYDKNNSLYTYINLEFIVFDKIID